jgi:type IV pilus assembly protein PilV
MSVSYTSRTPRGFTLLEVLITIVILAFGLLGLVNLQNKLHMTEMEAYQRAQAVVLLQDMSNRLLAAGIQTSPNPYLTGSGPLGTDDSEPCSPMPTSGAARDRCEWSRLLRGASETKDGSNVGAMIGARGCVEELQAPDGAAGVCRPGIYRITVAWQGLFQTAAPSLTCGQNLYGGATGESLRRAISTTVTIGLPKCTPP